MASNEIEGNDEKMEQDISPDLVQVNATMKEVKLCCITKFNERFILEITSLNFFKYEYVVVIQPSAPLTLPSPGANSGHSHIHCFRRCVGNISVYNRFKKE